MGGRQITSGKVCRLACSGVLKKVAGVEGGVLGSMPTMLPMVGTQLAQLPVATLPVAV
jgi:hypothetical protein